MKSILFISETPKRYSTIINDINESNHKLDVVQVFLNDTLNNIDFENYSLVIIDYNEKIGNFLDYANYYKLNNKYTKYLILVNTFKKIKNIDNYHMVLKEEMLLKYKAILDKIHSLDKDEVKTDDNYNKKKNVIVIDDDIISLEILNGILDSDEVEVKSFNNPIIAFNHIKQCIVKNKKIDLVLIDLNMPVLSGYNLIELVRSKSTTEEIPIMVISSNKVKSSIEAVAKHNIKGYIIKPFSKELLISRVNKVLGVS